MFSLMAARWVSQNSGTIFRRLWTIVQRIVCLCGSVRSLFQRRFPIDDVLLRSEDIHNQIVKLCEIAPNFDVFEPPNFGGRGHPNFGTSFKNHRAVIKSRCY